MTNKNNSMLLRGPSWATEGSGSNKQLITTHEDDEMDMTDLKKNGSESAASTVSMFQDSVSSFGSAFRGAFDSAIGSLKENVESEIHHEQTAEETMRDHAVKVEKDATIAHAHVMMGDEEFRRFKKQMHESGAVTTGAVKHNITKHIHKRASLDMNPPQRSVSKLDTVRTASMDLR
eukprot:CAMPEP_0119018798 /NCGR_PEP_ID=MMETSP1176-20130426/20258_1 /TAXON_ID=265551 /ORGANISM="Synedropsis recta cf, Strain CCMP1620" /LENGTH=175 /DNA_ID=CAMNT_0006972877 /DNA_START=85 /DNA_END=612 /DNA_ORIENTATION=+